MEEKKREKKNEGNYKKIVAILVIIVIICAFVAILMNRKIVENAFKESYVETLEDGTIRNVSERFLEMKFVNAIQISDINLEYKDGSTLSMILTNTSDSVQGGFEAIIKLRNGDSEPTRMLKTWVPKLEIGESTTVVIETKDNITDNFTFSMDEYPGYEEIMVDGVPQKVDVYAAQENLTF